MPDWLLVVGFTALVVFGILLPILWVGSDADEVADEAYEESLKVYPSIDIPLGERPKRG